MLMGLPDGRADATALLDWTLNVARLDCFARLPEDARNAIVARLGAEGGPAAKLVLAATAAGRGADALPVALACGVVFGEQDQHHTLREAAVRLEPLIGGTRVDPDAARALAEAGRRVLGRMAENAPAEARAIEARAAAILAEIRADTSAALSPALQVGLGARIEDCSGGCSTLGRDPERRRRCDGLGSGPRCGRP